MTITLLTDSDGKSKSVSWRGGRERELVPWGEMKTFLIVCCFAGIVIPYWFALPFFLIHGPNFRLFLEEVFGTRISSFFAADLIVASVIFLVWSRRDARERGMTGWWIVLVSNLGVGLSLALPLYLLKRLDAAK